MKNHLYYCLITLLMLSLINSCGLTPNPIYPRHKLANPGSSIYEVPLYSFSELYALFPGTDYSGLSSVYVSSTGDDTSGDGSSGSPFATVSRALQECGPGSIVRIRAGIYHEALWIAQSGSQGLPLVLYSQDGPGAARIDGGNAHSVISTTSDHIIIDGLELYNASSFGVGVYSRESLEGNLPDVEAGGNNVVIRNCIIHDVGEEGIKGAQNQYYLIEYNEIYNVRLEQGIDCVGTHHVIILSNYLHDNAGGAGYCKGGSANVYWVGNVIEGYDDQLFGIILGGQSSLYVNYPALDPRDIPEGYDQWVYNNVFINCGRMGILISNGERLRIYNNTFFNCNYTRNELISVSDERNKNFKPSSDIEIYNNLIKNDSSHPLIRFFYDPNHYPAVTFRHGFNSIDAANPDFQWSYDPEYFSPAPTDLLTVVSFSDSGAWDFSLQPGSGGLDDGTNLSLIVSNDIRGIVRPQGAAMDRGAYED